MNPEISQDNEAESKEKPKTVEELLERKECQLLTVKEIIFADLESPQIVKRSTKPIPKPGVPDRMAAQIDHYNVSEPIEVAGQELMLTREEERSSENSVVKAYIHNKEKDIWQPMTEVRPMAGYQDPSYLGEIKGQKCFCATNTQVNEKNEVINYWAELFAINGDLNHIEQVAKGPEKSKLLHLIQTGPEEIDGFIRMQGGEFGRGKICHFQIREMDDLQNVLDNIGAQTEIIDIFDKDEWGGFNDLHLLPDGRVDVLGHIARLVKDEKDQDKKEYYVFSAIFDPKTNLVSELKIILSRGDLPVEAEPKKPEVENVLYPNNSVLEDDKRHIYTSISDSKQVVATVAR